MGKHSLRPRITLIINPEIVVGSDTKKVDKSKSDKRKKVDKRKHDKRKNVGCGKSNNGERIAQSPSAAPARDAIAEEGLGLNGEDDAH